jgi:hypothetical protein
MKQQGLKALTLHRPWGRAVTHLGKDIENRTRNCPLSIGEYFAIHNGKKWDHGAVEFINQIIPIHSEPLDPALDPEMSIIAIAQFNGNLTESVSDWFMGPIGWVLINVVEIEPIQCRGQQNFWNVPDDLMPTVRQHYRAALLRNAA